MTPLTAKQRGLVVAMDLHRRHDPKTWRASVDAITDPEERAVAEKYLRDIIARMRAVSSLRKRGENRRP